MSARVLLVEDDRLASEQLRWALDGHHELAIAHDAPGALAAIGERPDIVLLDLCLPPSGTPDEGFRILEAALRHGAMAIVMSGLGERATALRAAREGAYDFLEKPVDSAVLRVVLARAVERLHLERENRRLRSEIKRGSGFPGIIGTSPAVQALLGALRRVADSPVNVLLCGESGTGKGLVARAIHDASARRDGPFVAVHCAAFPATLLEAELFGHEKGAFTGAERERVGRFEAASGGTLFLDEVECVPPEIQVKLLRVLEERVVERLGSNRPRPIDIRLVSATNEDLEAKVRRGETRADFYFRVKGFPLTLPPLRERASDVPLLAEHYLRRLCAERGIATLRLAPEAGAALMAHDWPGNVRELVHVVEMLALLCEDGAITADDVRRACPAAAPVLEIGLGAREGFKAAVERFEKRVLTEAIVRAAGVKARAARELHLDPHQMKHLVKKHGL